VVAKAEPSPKKEESLPEEAKAASESPIKTFLEQSKLKAELPAQEDAIDPEEVKGLEDGASKIEKLNSINSAESLDRDQETQSLEMKEGGSSEDEWEQQNDDEPSQPPESQP
jgi:hypothetical protein